ncbi:MAG: sigma-54-dependent Fis family transcriptional regulator [Deltaproteobacteria bacterium]|nr:MAG: sigma-54-dependent Fis family transcriptional regulator [Deltaproteobacteria bacterium]
MRCSSSYGLMPSRVSEVLSIIGSGRRVSGRCAETSARATGGRRRAILAFPGRLGNNVAHCQPEEWAPMGERDRGVLDLDADTRQIPQYGRAAPPTSVPALTLLYHPRLTRIGERVKLPELTHPSSRVAVSRLKPELAPPFQPSAALPLASPFVSRRPVWIAAEYDGSFTIDVREGVSGIVVDGVAVTDTHTVGAADVERGVVLEIGGSVVLLLHRLERQQRPAERYSLIGDSDGIAQVRRHIERVARLQAPVLVRGETGTGKELVARAVHDASERADKAYLTVNMAAIPSSLAASELFGHVRGAFSGASHANAGFFGRADGGTLFMDEVADTPSEVQAALLRVLETGEVQQVGAERIRQVDVRLIAATDADIEKEVETGRFRAPLFYRLANQEIRLPALRERKDDVARLLVHFLERELDALGRAEELLDADAQGMSWLPAAVVARLVRYAWPGNVRQLRSVARYLASVEHRKAALLVDDPQLGRLMPNAGSAVPTLDASADELRARLAALEAERPSPVADAPKKRAPSDIGPDELERVLAALDYKLGPAAAELGISRPALNDLVDAHPTLVRANTLTREALVAALERYEGPAEELWRVLKVSKRGLKLRLSELGLA